MSAQLVDRRPEGPRGWLLSVAVPAAQALAYTAPGQYCRLGVSGEGGYFAIASAPGTSPFEFYIQPAGGVSDRLVALEVGAALEVAEPMGPGFGLDRVLASPGPVWVLAAGSGLSGVRAALGVLAGRSVHLLVGVREEADLIFASEINALRARGLDVEVVESRPAHGAGRYVQQVLAARAPDLRDAWVLACGPDGMVAACRDGCASLGLPAERFLLNY